MSQTPLPQSFGYVDPFKTPNTPHDPKYLPTASTVSQFRIPPAAPVYNQTQLPFMKRHRPRNFAFAVAITAFCYQVAYYSFNVVQRDDFTKDPHYSEVMSEIKREEIISATKHLDRRGVMRQ